MKGVNKMKTELIITDENGIIEFTQIFDIGFRDNMQDIYDVAGEQDEYFCPIADGYLYYIKNEKHLNQLKPERE